MECNSVVLKCQLSAETVEVARLIPIAAGKIGATRIGQVAAMQAAGRRRGAKAFYGWPSHTSFRMPRGPKYFISHQRQDQSRTEQFIRVIHVTLHHSARDAAVSRDSRMPDRHTRKLSPLCLRVGSSTYRGGFTAVPKAPTEPQRYASTQSLSKIVTPGNCGRTPSQVKYHVI